MAPGMAPPMGGPGGMGAMPMGAISKANRRGGGRKVFHFTSSLCFFVRGFSG